MNLSNRDLQSPDPLKVQQLAVELAADLSLSSRLSLAARVDRAMADRCDKAWSERLESTLTALEEKGHLSEDGEDLSLLLPESGIKPASGDGKKLVSSKSKLNRKKTRLPPTIKAPASPQKAPISLNHCDEKLKSAEAGLADCHDALILKKEDGNNPSHIAEGKGSSDPKHKDIGKVETLVKNTEKNPESPEELDSFENTGKFGLSEKSSSCGDSEKPDSVGNSDKLNSFQNSESFIKSELSKIVESSGSSENIERSDSSKNIEQSTFSENIEQSGSSENIEESLSSENNENSAFSLAKESDLCNSSVKSFLSTDEKSIDIKNVEAPPIVVGEDNISASANSTIKTKVEDVKSKEENNKHLNLKDSTPEVKASGGSKFKKGDTVKDSKQNSEEKSRSKKPYEKKTRKEGHSVEPSKKIPCSDAKKKSDSDAKTSSSECDVGSECKKKDATIDSRKKTVPERTTEFKRKVSETEVVSADARKKLSETDLRKSSSHESSNNKVLLRTPTVNMNKAWQVRQAFNQSRTPIKQQGSGPRYAAPSASSQGFGSKGKAPQTTNTKLSRRASLLLPATKRSSVTPTNAPRPGVGMTRSHTTLCAPSSAPTQSWADKVRGHNSSFSAGATTPSSAASSTSLLSSVGESSSSATCGYDEAGDGWEVVRRGRRSHGGSTASLNKHHGQSQPSRAGNWIKKRFDVPSTATSMPSLAALGNTPSNALQQNSKIKRISRRSAGECMSGGPHNRRVSLEGASVSALCSFDDPNDVFEKLHEHQTPQSNTKDTEKTKAVESDKMPLAKGVEKSTRKTPSDSKKVNNFLKEHSKKKLSSSEGQLQNSLSDESLHAKKLSNEEKRKNLPSKNIKEKKDIASSKQKLAKLKADPKNFFSRGKSVSDNSIEVRRKDDAIKPSEGPHAAFQDEATEFAATPEEASAPSSSRRYGALMAEVHEVDEETVEPLRDVGVPFLTASARLVSEKYQFSN